MTTCYFLGARVEAIAVSTGLPYGRFYYSKSFGHMVLGLLPWTVAFAYLPFSLDQRYLPID